MFQALRCQCIVEVNNIWRWLPAVVPLHPMLCVRCWQLSLYCSNLFAEPACASNNSAEWLKENFGPFSVFVSIPELVSLNPQFNPVRLPLPHCAHALPSEEAHPFIHSSHPPISPFIHSSIHPFIPPTNPPFIHPSIPWQGPTVFFKQQIDFTSTLSESSFPDTCIHPSNPAGCGLGPVPAASRAN